MDASVLAASQRVLAEQKVPRKHDGVEKPVKSPPPSACGRKAKFEQAEWHPGPFQDLQVAEKVIMKLSRPDLLCDMRHAVNSLERQAALQSTHRCKVFGACEGDERAADMKKISRRSEAFFACPSRLVNLEKFTRRNASRLVRGGARAGSLSLLPGELGEAGDENAFCKLAELLIRGLETQVIPSYNLKRHECLMHEVLVNQQRSGAWTNPHQHSDAFFGGAYYLDAPKDSRLCFESSSSATRSKIWRTHAPELVTSFGDEAHSAAHAEVQQGDLLLHPVNWLPHWVPPIEERNATRTAVVFNINCIRAPPLERLGEKLQMPMLGFGTCCRKSSKGEALRESLALYFQAGGRLVDTAFLYKNHEDVREAINASRLNEDEIWITDKIMPWQMGKTNTTKAVRASREELGWRRLNLMLIHRPNGTEKNVDTWKALLEAQKEGLLRHVGVSNFNQSQIEELKAATGVLPAVNQIEFSPFSPKEVHTFVKWMQRQGIAVTAFGSLGHAKSNVAEHGCGEVCAELAKKYGKTQAQILLRWALEKHVAVIPGATSGEHIEENLDVEDFALSPAEQKELEEAEKPEKWRKFHIPGH